MSNIYNLSDFIGFMDICYDIKGIVDSRLKSFSAERSNQDLFKELCFCLMTANYNAEKAIEIQGKIDNGFLNLSLEELQLRLKELGYRYPNVRAQYIVEARKHKDVLKDILSSFKENELRSWFVNNVKGLGLKEASHFLRNVGYFDYAIIDFHIVDLLVKEGLIVKPKVLNKKTYLEIEDVLFKIAKKEGLSLGALDLYLWYAETGKILK